jgi:hypothetical protein
MTRTNRTSSLFFAALLGVLSIFTQYYGVLISSGTKISQSDYSVSSLPGGKPELIFMAHREERSLNSVKNQPVPDLKNHSNNSIYFGLFPEVRLSGFHTGYLAYSVIVERSLTNRDIVFPFHYFW